MKKIIIILSIGLAIVLLESLSVREQLKSQQSTQPKPSPTPAVALRPMRIVQLSTGSFAIQREYGTLGWEQIGEPFPTLTDAEEVAKDWREIVDKPDAEAAQAEFRKLKVTGTIETIE